MIAFAGVAFAVPGRKLVLRQVFPILRRSVGAIGAVMRNPAKVVLLFGGSALVTLELRVRALLLDARRSAATCVSRRSAPRTSPGATVASVAPTPGRTRCRRGRARRRAHRRGHAGLGRPPERVPLPARDLLAPDPPGLGGFHLAQAHGAHLMSEHEQPWRAGSSSSPARPAASARGWRSGTPSRAPRSCARRAPSRATPSDLPGTIEETVERSRARAAAALAVRCDIGIERDLQALVERTIDEYGRVDSLMNNAMAPTRALVRRVDRRDVGRVDAGQRPQPLPAHQARRAAHDRAGRREHREHVVARRRPRRQRRSCRPGTSPTRSRRPRWSASPPRSRPSSSPRASR